mmetsp:Transcript_68236/g.118718  ORF Transcript_68236/g.118718 Transcript_68236/m.118718 type:complete len:174 (+) Transcript_68236:815-1336(+)
MPVLEGDDERPLLLNEPNPSPGEVPSPAFIVSPLRLASRNVSGWPALTVPCRLLGPDEPCAAVDEALLGGVGAAVGICCLDATRDVGFRELAALDPALGPCAPPLPPTIGPVREGSVDLVDIGFVGPGCGCLSSARDSDAGSEFARSEDVGSVLELEGSTLELAPSPSMSLLG